jgi:hypothetical protein
MRWLEVAAIGLYTFLGAFLLWHVVAFLLRPRQPKPPVQPGGDAALFMFQMFLWALWAIGVPVALLALAGHFILGWP